MKKELLIGIIQEYIKYKEPIGSEYLKAKQNLRISSATIRNYFKILEKEGALFQPHISSGRIPTNATLCNYWKDVLQCVCENESYVNTAQLHDASTRYGVYCIVIPKSDNVLEDLIHTQNYLILKFSRGESVIHYTEALARFLESFLHTDIHDIIKVANEVGAGELKRKLISLMQVDFEESCFQCGSEYIGAMAACDSGLYLNAMQGRTFLICGNGIYFDKIVPEGYIAVIHDTHYANAKIRKSYKARMMCIGDVAKDYKGFYAGLGFANFA